MRLEKKTIKSGTGRILWKHRMANIPACSPGTGIILPPYKQQTHAGFGWLFSMESSDHHLFLQTFACRPPPHTHPSRLFLLIYLQFDSQALNANVVITIDVAGFEIKHRGDEAELRLTLRFPTTALLQQRTINEHLLIRQFLLSRTLWKTNQHLLANQNPEFTSYRVNMPFILADVVNQSLRSYTEVLNCIIQMY